MAISTSHQNKQEKFLAMIWTLLENHPSQEMRYLGQMTKDPETDLPIRQFWLTLLGEPTMAKKHLLNAVLSLFSHWYRKAEYRGRDVETMSDEELAQVSLGPTHSLFVYFLI